MILGILIAIGLVATLVAIIQQSLPNKRKIKSDKPQSRFAKLAPPVILIALSLSFIGWVIYFAITKFIG